MGFLQEDFIGNPNKPEYILEGDIEYPSDDDQALFEVGDLLPGDADLILFNNIDIDNDEDYNPDDDYDDFLTDEDFSLEEEEDDDLDSIIPETTSEDEESSNDNENSDEKPSDDSVKVNGEHKNINGTDSVNNAAESNSTS